jgi:hypothetical protein
MINWTQDQLAIKSYFALVLQKKDSAYSLCTWKDFELKYFSKFELILKSIYCLNQRSR